MLAGQLVADWEASAKSLRRNELRPAPSPGPNHTPGFSVFFWPGGPAILV